MVSCEDLARVTAAAGKVIPKGKVTRKKLPRFPGEAKKRQVTRDTKALPSRSILLNIGFDGFKTRGHPSTAVRTVAKFAAGAATSCTEPYAAALSPVHAYEIILLY